LVTDELIGDAGVSSSAGSYAGISFTSLVIENVDAEAVSSVKGAKSLPAVGVLPIDPVRQYVALAGVLALVVGIGGLCRPSLGSPRFVAPIVHRAPPIASAWEGTQGRPSPSVAQNAS